MVPSAPVEGSTPASSSLTERVLVSCPQLITAKALCVAYSGGLDSTVLLHLLWCLRQQGVLVGELRALHVHHGLQAAADSWQLHCADQCRQRGIVFTACRVQVDSSGGQSPEAAARQARYNAFSAELRTDEILVLAHHRDDQAETLLLRLLRGSGSAGLAGMPGSRELGAGRLQRPLLGIAREELQQYADSEKLQWVEDPSNADDNYDRNYLRSDILPLLRRRWPAAAATMARSAALLQEAAQLLDELADTDLAVARLDYSNRLGVLQLQALGEARQRNLLRHWLATLPADLAVPLPSYQVLQRCAQQLLAPTGQDHVMLAWGQGETARELHRYRDTLVVLRPLPAVLPSLAWSTAQPLLLPAPLGALHWLAPSPPALPLTVRFRAGGERIAKADGRHHSFKDFCQRRGIPPWVRHAMPMLYHGEELLAIGDEVLPGTTLAQPVDSSAVLRWQRSHLLCGW